MGTGEGWCVCAGGRAGDKFQPGVGSPAAWAPRRAAYSDCSSRRDRDSDTRPCSHAEKRRCRSLLGVGTEAREAPQRPLRPMVLRPSRLKSPGCSEGSGPASSAPALQRLPRLRCWKRRTLRPALLLHEHRPRGLGCKRAGCGLAGPPRRGASAARQRQADRPLRCRLLHCELPAHGLREGLLLLVPRECRPRGHCPRHVSRHWCRSGAACRRRHEADAPQRLPGCLLRCILCAGNLRQQHILDRKQGGRGALLRRLLSLLSLLPYLLGLLLLPRLLRRLLLRLLHLLQKHVAGGQLPPAVCGLHEGQAASRQGRRQLHDAWPGWHAALRVRHHQHNHGGSWRRGRRR